MLHPQRRPAGDFHFRGCWDAEMDKRSTAISGGKCRQIAGSLKNFFMGTGRVTRFRERYAADAEFRERQRQKYRSFSANHPELLERKKVKNRRERKGLGEIVYFVRALSGGPIKIGFTNRNPDVRLRMLQIGNWEPLTIVAVIPGGRRAESDLHFRFSRLLVRGEWFRAAPELTSFIADNATPWPVSNVVS